MAQTEYDWASCMWDNWQVIAFERVSPDHVIAVQMYPPNRLCFFNGEAHKVPEHKKRNWERALEKVNG